MKRFFKDIGIVLKKRKLLKDNRNITILTREGGKMNLLGFGVRKLLSKRSSHLETGNYIAFTFYKKGEMNILGETEIIWGFSKIKRSEVKLGFLYLLFFIVDRIMPENQVDSVIFEKTLYILKKINNRNNFTLQDLRVYLNDILLISGFINKKQSNDINFNSLQFIESLIDQKINWAFATKGSD